MIMKHPYLFYSLFEPLSSQSEEGTITTRIGYVS